MSYLVDEIEVILFTLRNGGLTNWGNGYENAMHATWLKADTQ